MHKERLKEIATLLLNFNDPMTETDWEILGNVAYELQDASDEYETSLLVELCSTILEEDE